MDTKCQSIGVCWRLGGEWLTISRAVCGSMLIDAALITILTLVAISEYVIYRGKEGMAAR